MYIIYILILYFRSQHTWKNSPCWESILDIYPRPCGNMTDSEKEILRGGTKSECGRPNKTKYKVFSDSVSMCGERSFDKLYLKAALSCPKLREICDDKNHNYSKNNSVHHSRRRLNSKVTQRHTLLIVEENYEGSCGINSLPVKKGDVVILLQEKDSEVGLNNEWFYVRNTDGIEGFIPASITGYGFL